MSKSEITNGSHRLQTFSDAVFAFACTLLVVSLEVPKSFAELLKDMQGFVAFGLAFSALIYIWSIHHRLFRRFPLDDDWSVILNSSLLFVVLFFVYPLKFLATQFVADVLGVGKSESGSHLLFSELRTLFAIYGGAFAAVFLLIASLYWRAARLAVGVHRDGALPGDALILARHYLVIACVAGLSVLLALFDVGMHIGLPGWIYFLIGPAAWINGWVAGRTRR